MGQAKIVRSGGQWFHLLHRPGNRPVSAWFVHGLGDWSAAWRGAFEHPALAGRELVIVDLPGFGRTPAEAGNPPGLERMASRLSDLVSETVGEGRVILVGHSMGGVIGTLIAETRPRWLAGLVNVEGNLTIADCTISARVAGATDFARWYEKFADTVYREGVEKRALRHYHAGLFLVDRPTFLSASRDLVRLSTGGEIGKRYAALSVPRVYFYGTAEFDEASRKLLEERGLAREGFEGAGHWVMGDAQDDFYRRLGDWIPRLAGEGA